DELEGDEELELQLSSKSQRACVTSHAFRILMDHVCNGCSGHCEASVVWTCGMRSALVVGGTDTSSRHWSPASPSPVPHSSEPRPGSLEVPGMGLRPCGPQ
ncbi:hypothetical protein Taro_049328, partial [Colocasia esculenta]|nr:hypothetical protein [Colocasia esculenta]